MIAIYALSALILAAVVAAVAGYVRNLSLKKKITQGEIDEMTAVKQPP